MTGRARPVGLSRYAAALTLTDFEGSRLPLPALWASRACVGQPVRRIQRWVTGASQRCSGSIEQIHDTTRADEAGSSSASPSTAR